MEAAARRGRLTDTDILRSGLPVLFFSKIRHLTGGAEPPPYDVIVYYILRIAVYLRLIFIGASGTLRPTRVAE